MARNGAVMKSSPTLPLLVLLALAGTCCAPASKVPTHAKLASDLEDKSVELVAIPDPEADLAKCEDGDIQCIIAAALEDKEPHVYCSGEWVSPTQILTAQHCMEDSPVGATKLFAVEADVTPGKDGVVIGYHEAQVVMLDALHDLALLHVAGPVPAHDIAVLSNAVIYPGSDAFAMGNPLGMGWSFSAGVVAQIRYIAVEDKPLWYIQATTPISPGSSGGGLYDEMGMLIGVTKANAPRGENINIFVHRDDIRAFLKAAGVLS